MVSLRVPLPNVRLSPGAWPKLPGEQLSQAKRSRSLDMDVHGDDLAVASRKEDAVTVPDGYQVNTLIGYFYSTRKFASLNILISPSSCDWVYSSEVGSHFQNDMR